MIKFIFFSRFIKMTMERCFDDYDFLRLQERNRFLEEENARLRSELEAFKFSELVQKTLANERRAQTQVLMQEVEKLNT